MGEAPKGEVIFFIVIAFVTASTLAANLNVLTLPFVFAVLSVVHLRWTKKMAKVYSSVFMVHKFSPASVRSFGMMWAVIALVGFYYVSDKLFKWG